MVPASCLQTEFKKLSKDEGIYPDTKDVRQSSGNSTVSMERKLQGTDYGKKTWGSDKLEQDKTKTKTTTRGRGKKGLEELDTAFA